MLQVLFTCFKRADKKEVKVAQLAGAVGEMSAYHHGEVCATFFCKPMFFIVVFGNIFVFLSGLA